jgi:hypothetical protein
MADSWLSAAAYSETTMINAAWEAGIARGEVKMGAWMI